VNMSPGCFSVLLFFIAIPLVSCFALPPIRGSAIAASKATTAIASSKQDKQSWDIFRFLKTVTFYNKPKLPFFPSSSNGQVMKMKPGDTIWSKEGGGISWGALDDVVMGGVSKSDIDSSNFRGEWRGFVTSANNGGFAGIRSKLFEPPRDCSSARGILLTVKGDGNRFKFIARDDPEWNGTAWTFAFDTVKDRIIEVKVPFDKLIPTKFARRVSLGRTFNREQLNGIQLTLSKFEFDGALNPRFTEGSFSLDLESVKLF